MAELLSLDVFESLIDTLDGAELLQEFGGRLVADSRDAGDIIGRVALETEEVGNLLGGDTIALVDLIAIIDDYISDAFASRHHPHSLIGNQLESVLVAGDHQDVVASQAPFGGQGG